MTCIVTQNHPNFMVGIVFYRPTAEQLRHAISAASFFNDACFVFNETPDISIDIAELRQSQSIRVIVNHFNLGIASAINQISTIFLTESNSALLLILDQDTEVNLDTLEATAYDFKEILATGQESFALSAALIDRKSSPSIKADNPTLNDPISKKIWLSASSGTFFTRQCLERVGPMNGELFIDGVDHDWCLRAAAKQVPIYRVSGPPFNHSIGEAGFTLRGRFFPLHISPIRHYFVIRNSAYLLRFGIGPLPLRLKIFLSAIIRVIPYLITSVNRRQSIRSIFYAAIHGFTGRLGPYPF